MPYATYKNKYSRTSRYRNYILTNICVHHNDKYLQTIALWDTGSSRTHITEDVISAFNLESRKSKETLCHSGNSESKIYVISIELPTGCELKDIEVFQTTNININDIDIGVIIGLDIISCGDFHIDYTGENTVFTFRHPADEYTYIETELF